MTRLPSRRLFSVGMLAMTSAHACAAEPGGAQGAWAEEEIGGTAPDPGIASTLEIAADGARHRLRRLQPLSGPSGNRLRNDPLLSARRHPDGLPRPRHGAGEPLPRGDRGGAAVPAGGRAPRSSRRGWRRGRAASAARVSAASREGRA